jgi:heme/copper-type cytochrome/quinol oxidase subunit 4
MIYVIRIIGALLSLALTLLCVVMSVRSGSGAWVLAAIVSGACTVGTLGR